MFGVFSVFRSEATVTTQLLPGSSITPLHPDEERQQCPGRLANLARQFVTFKSMLFCPSYYDPYQREQQAEDPSNVMIDPHPTKTERRSVTSTIFDSVVDGIYYGAKRVIPAYLWSDRTADTEKSIREKKSDQRKASVVSLFQQPVAWKYRLKQVHHFIRKICLQEHEYEEKDSLTNASFFPPLAMQAYRQVLDDEKNAWGIVFRDGLLVHFTQPFTSPVLDPPPKPKRKYAFIAKTRA